ncbi:sigma-70 family RNA polymerase sigma factor [Microbacterium lacusdiani]
MHASPADPSPSDAELVRRSRAGDAAAFAALWTRHHGAALTVARSIGAGTDADDLVQEAFARVFGILRRGGGPTGPFRAYLFTAIRNTAVSWARARHDTAAIDELEALPDPATTEDARLAADDHGLVLRAFRTLPRRWQEVLWYCEIEGLGPSDAAPLLGMSAGAVKQLAFRAREGLREAWIQAHVAALGDGADCRWTIARLGAHARGRLTASRRARVEAHLDVCPPCAGVAAEARQVGIQLAPALLPALVGAAAAAAYLAPAGRAMAMSSALTPVPAALAPVGALAIAAPGTLAVGALVSTGVATLTLAGALVGGAVAAAPASPAPLSGTAAVQEAPAPEPAAPPRVTDTRSAAPETTPAPAVTAPAASAPPASSPSVPRAAPSGPAPSSPVPPGPAPTPPAEVGAAAEVAEVVDVDVAADADGVSAAVDALDSVQAGVEVTDTSAAVDASADLSAPGPVDASVGASVGAVVGVDPSPDGSLDASLDASLDVDALDAVEGATGAGVDASLDATVGASDGAVQPGVELEVDGDLPMPIG